MTTPHNKELSHVALTPIVRQNLDQLYSRWEEEEARLYEEAADKSPFGSCYAAVCPALGYVIKQGATLTTPMTRVGELSTSGVSFQLVAALHCYWPREVVVVIVSFGSSGDYFVCMLGKYLHVSKILTTHISADRKTNP